MRFKMRSTALPADMFHRTPVKYTTTMTPAHYQKLLEAARSKHKMAEFLKWQRDRKIILKD